MFVSSCFGFSVWIYDYIWMKYGRLTNQLPQLIYFEIRSFDFVPGSIELIFQIEIALINQIETLWFGLFFVVAVRRSNSLDTFSSACVCVCPSYSLKSFFGMIFFGRAKKQTKHEWSTKKKKKIFIRQKNHNHNNKTFWNTQQTT